MVLDIILKKDEECYSKFEATKLDSETDYSDFFTESDDEDGFIYITSQRFIFKGDKKTKTIPMAKILACNNEEYTIKISPENGESITYDTKEALASSVCRQILAIINDEEILPLERNEEVFKKKELEYQKHVAEIEEREKREKIAAEKKEKSEQRNHNLLILSLIAFVVIVFFFITKINS